MNWSWRSGRSATLDKAPSRPDREKLRALIDQATSDSVDESDEHAGLLSTIRAEVVCPFRARLGDAEVECVRFEYPRNGYGLNDVCRSGGRTVTVDVGKLDLLEPLPQGHRWIEAYLAWRDLFD